MADMHHETLTDDKFAVVRYTTTGELDTSFGEPVALQDTSDDSETTDDSSGSATGSSGGCALATSVKTSKDFVIIAMFIILAACQGFKIRASFFL